MGSTTTDDFSLTNMSPLLQSKLFAMIGLCSVSFLLGLLPLKLVKLFNMKVPACKAHSHGESEQPLAMSLMLCFGGGVLLYTTFLHLQPEVRESMEELGERGELPEFVTKYQIHFADLIFCAGFFLVYIIEEVVHAIIDRGAHNHEDQAVLHRTMSLRKCGRGGGFDHRHKTGTIIPRASLAPSRGLKDLPGDASLSVSINSRHELLYDNGILGTINGKRVQSELPHLTTTPSDIPESESSVETSEPKTEPTSFRGFFAVLALSFHEVFEGLVVGLELNVQNVWYLFAAIATHKFVLSFCLGVELVSTKTRVPVLLVYIAAFAVVTPVGITAGIIVLATKDETAPGGSFLTVLMQGVASGTLLYVTFFEILQREKANTKSGVLQLIAIVVGFSFMLSLQMLTGHQHSHGGHHHHEHDHDHHDHDHDHVA